MITDFYNTNQTITDIMFCYIRMEFFSRLIRYKFFSIFNTYIKSMYIDYTKALIILNKKTFNSSDISKFYDIYLDFNNNLFEYYKHVRL